MKPSSAMIPGEILCSLIGLVLAYFGGVHDGWLQRELAQRHGEMVWLLALGAPALVALAGGLREWFGSRGWNLFQREANVRWRARAMLAQGLCWLYAVYFGFDGGPPLIGSIGTVCLSFCAWAYHENRRACREIRYATSPG